MIVHGDVVLVSLKLPQSDVDGDEVWESERAQQLHPVID